MAFKEVIVQAGSGAADAARMSLAADLAHRSGGSLTGVLVTPPPITAYLGGLEGASLSGLSLAELAEQQTAEFQKDAAKTQAALAAAAKASGLTPAFRTLSGDSRAEMIRLARQADLVVLPSPDDSGSGNESAPEEIAMTCGGPCLFVHAAWSTRPIGKRILVAWNGSRESARALKDALPMLHEAEHIDVLVIDKDDATHDVETTLPAYLAKHGLTAQVHRVSSVDNPVGDVMLRQAGRLDSDLIVMGLYGHARMQEMVLGGASRHILRHARMPLLVSH